MMASQVHASNTNNNTGNDTSTLNPWSNYYNYRYRYNYNYNNDHYFVSEDDYWFSFPDYPDVRYSDLNWFLSIMTFHKVFRVTFPAIVLATGIVGNLINMVVFYRRGFHDNNCTPSLVALTFSDLFHCVFGLLHILSRIGVPGGPLFSYQIKRENMNRLWSFTKTPTKISDRFSEWVTGYLAFERMVSVTFFPFKVKVFFVPKRSYFAIIGIGVMALLSHVHLFFSLEFLYTPFAIDWRTGEANKKFTSIASDTLMVMLIYMHERVFEPMCILLIFVFAMIIVFRINVSKRYKQIKSKSAAKNDGGELSEQKLHAIKSQDNNHQQKPNAQTNNSNKTNTDNNNTMHVGTEVILIRLVVVMCAFFVVCYFPVFFLYYLREHYTGIQEENPPKYGSIVFDLYYEVQVMLLPFLKSLYTSWKCVLYFGLDPAYRKELRRMCTCRKRKSELF